MQITFNINDAVATDVAQSLIDFKWTQVREQVAIERGVEPETLDTLTLQKKAKLIIRWYIALNSQRWLNKAATEAVVTPFPTDAVEDN